MKDETDNKQPPKVARAFVALVIIIFLLCVSLVFIFGKQVGIDTPLQITQYVAAAAIVAMILLAIHALVEGGRISTYVKQLRPFGRTRVAEAQGAADKTYEAMQSRFTALRLKLQGYAGRRWKYDRPWLLVSGDDGTISELLPDIAETGWLVTPDVVLLQCPTDAYSLPDDRWLRQIRRQRRRRPIDGVVVLATRDDAKLAKRSVQDSYRASVIRIAERLNWSAPVYVLNIEGNSEQQESDLIGCDFGRRAESQGMKSALQVLCGRLAYAGVGRMSIDRRDTWLARLSQHLDMRDGLLADLCAHLGDIKRLKQSVRGIFFHAIPKAKSSQQNLSSGAQLHLWHELGMRARRAGGVRIGLHPSTVGATVVTIVACLWMAGMFMSGASNTREFVFANQLSRDLASTPSGRPGLHALRDLQQDIERFEYRAADGAPWYARFGLNRDKAILAGLWQAYAPASRRLLVSPVQQGLESSLATVAAMRTDVSDETTNRQALAGHQTLRAYLMLAGPKRADAKLMEPELVRHWLSPAGLTTGERQDLAHQFFPFFARHLQAHPEWAIQPRSDLVNGTRQVLLALIGTSNSTDTIYRSIVDPVAGKYGDQSLATLLAGTDSRGLFRTAATVPGVFTRQAWDGQISQAIDDAAQRKNVTGDWVLNAAATAQPVQSGEALRKSLREMYFEEYARQWQAFANSIQWVSATTLPAIAEQLRLLADSRQSPMIALMKALEYQGRAGENVTSLSDTLVAKAQNLIGNHAYAGAVESAAQAALPKAPLDASFGPVLRLVNAGQSQGKTDSTLSLQRYLDAVTTLRLKIEAMTNSGSMDDQARQIAQAQFQGKSSELSDTRNYAGLIAASLGEQWSGLGDSLFLRPVDQAMQAVMQPAQASLNDAWRQGIANPWTRAFQGRYPFASSDDDASFPELVRFLRDQTGLVPAFISQQLAGALELQGDHWVPTSAGTGLRFDPAFLKAINVLQGIASHLLASGAAQYRFDLMPQPSADVTQTQLTVDGQTLKYFNQADRWQPFVWPGNDLLVTGTRLEWQTVQAGLNKSFEKEGRWAFIRMLASANVEPLSDARFKLTWKASPTPVPAMAAAEPASQPSAASAPAAASSTMASDPATLTPKAPVIPAPKSFTYPITYVMRTDAGKGPLELLALRGFTMPTRIFAPAPAAGAMKAAGPPPLPASAVAAARRAAVSLPHGTVPDVE
jgi:type VI secretion system protein ImpL